MRIVFMGTPAFAVPSLKALLENGFNVVGVFTQPDKPKGRGAKLQESDVKIYAKANNIPVFQPVKIRQDGVKMLKELKPDYCVTAAFGQILSQEVLDIPKATINVHASLLPKHRGAAPAQWAILNGDEKTGVSTMLTDVGIDTGNILLMQTCAIDNSDTSETLLKKLSTIGAELLIKTLNNIDAIVPTKQDDKLSSYDPIINKEMGQMDFSNSAEFLNRQVRAMQPWPKAYFTSENGNNYKITETKVLSQKSNIPPGTVVIANEKLIISTGSNDLEIEKLQAPNKNEVTAKAYLLGNKVKDNMPIQKAFK